ncbi:hypothetical protein C482_08541 [Natrialba chahannaoensis JCM 10990]|uniref:eCIS core domain-containing protein n=1 Tax=Natrialba chahannaoensis JCM 10990 TaxID=1227492 RepID=M0ARQ1_9EURY|nr:DUF4157 domain-containing protein [Natrialba chahannaoensis]ELZ01230.1 hypothetical protein C482_08541 [Natrialba chahannaoensis JCM 10990]
MKHRSNQTQSRTSSDEAETSNSERRQSRTTAKTETGQASSQVVSTAGAAVDASVQRVPQAVAPQEPGLGPLASARAEAIRERFENRPAAVPDDNSRQNLASLQRSKQPQHDATPAGETGVPETVRGVLSSPGRSLDGAIQRAMEERMGDSFGDVRIHTDAQAAQACEEINARAFTVGNHIAFNDGEYDPTSPEGQHILAHELAHVRQQTGGVISMMPKPDANLQIDPDPQLEQEAEETAQRVMAGGELGIQRMQKTEIHVQRMVQGTDAVAAGNSKRISEVVERVSSIEDTLENISGKLESYESKLDEHEDSVGRLWSKVGQLKSNSTEESFSTEQKVAMGIGGGALLGGLGDFLKEGMDQMIGASTGDPQVDLALATVIGATAGGVTTLAGMGLGGLKDQLTDFRNSSTADEPALRDDNETGDNNSEGLT